MSDFEKVQMPKVPGWKRDIYKGDTAKSEWYPPIANQHVEDVAGASHSWDHQPPGSSANPIGSSANPIGGKRESSPGKRTTVESDPDVSETEPEHKRRKIQETSSTIDKVSLAGNAAKENLRTVADVFSTTSKFDIRAMWLIVEPCTGPHDAYGQAWLRPATQLCEQLEKQLGEDIGCQSCTLTYENNYGPPIVHYFEHDLRGDMWVQRRFYDEEQSQLKSEKQLLRVLIGT